MGSIDGAVLQRADDIFAKDSDRGLTGRVGRFHGREQSAVPESDWLARKWRESRC